MQTHCKDRKPKRALHAAGVILTLVGVTGVATAESFEMVTHERDIFGVRDIENGNYEKGVQRLEKLLGNGDQAKSVRTPILIDLCVGYTMLGDYEKATDNCDKAVGTGWYSGVAYNNRGAMKVAQGRYDEAVRDFQSAIEASGAHTVARRNLDRAQRRVAELRRQKGTSVAGTFPQGTLRK